jgi:hypothetical protein
LGAVYGVRESVNGEQILEITVSQTLQAVDGVYYTL